MIDYHTNFLPKPALDRLSERQDYPRFRPETDQPGADAPLDTLVELGPEARRMWFETGPATRIPISPAFWQPAGQVEAASRAGVEMVVSTAVLFAELWDLDPDESASVQDLVNTEMAAAQDARPAQFVGAATLPLNAPRVAMEVLDRAIAAGLRAVLIPATIDGGPIVGDELLPLYQRMDEAGMTVILHPSTRTGTPPHRMDPAIEIGFGWLYYSGAAAFSLILSGTLDACPNLTVIHPHLGAAIPWGYSRWIVMPNGRAQRPILDYLRERFYVDTGVTTPGALAVAANVYGEDRILLGSDYPFVEFEGAIEALDGETSPELARAVKERVVPGLIPAARGT